MMMDNNPIAQQAQQVSAELIGLRVMLPAPCPRCCSSIAALGAGKAMHKASVICQCERYLGWVSAETYSFLTETVRNFGKPTEPIQIRHRMSLAPRCEGCGDIPEQTKFDFASGVQAPSEENDIGPAISP